MGAGIPLSKGTYIEAGLPNNAKYFNDTLPYVSTVQVNQILPKTDRHIGLVVNINSIEFWYKDGVEDEDLIEKTTGGSSDFSGNYNDLEEKPDLSVKLEAADIVNKVDKVAGKGLSENDYTDLDRQKVLDNELSRVGSDDRDLWGEKMNPWIAKVYKNQTVTVTHNRKIYKLLRVVPFLSSDIDTEIIEGDWSEVSVSFPVPVIKSVSPLYVSTDTSVTMSILGSYFTPQTTVTIGGLITSYNVIDDRIITVELTTDGVLKGHDILVTNESGVAVFSSQFFVATETIIIPNASTWVSLGINGSDLIFADGEVMPNSLNSSQDRRTKSNSVLIPSNRDFQLDFIFKTQVGGTLTTGAYIGLISDVSSYVNYTDCFFSCQLTTNNHNIYKNGIIEGGLAATDLEVISIRRELGVITCHRGNGTVAVTLSESNSASFYLVTQIAHHIGLQNIQLTLKS